MSAWGSQGRSSESLISKIVPQKLKSVTILPFKLLTSSDVELLITVFGDKDCLLVELNATKSIPEPDRLLPLLSAAMAGSRLKSLAIGSMDFTSDHLALLLKHPLQLSALDLRNKALTTLVSLPQSLTSLDLSRNSGLVLSPLPDLFDLKVDECDLVTSDLRFLPGTLETLEARLNPKIFEDISGEVAANLGSMKKLVLADSPMPPAVLKELLSCLTATKELDLTRCIIEAPGADVWDNLPLETLVLAGCKLELQNVLPRLKVKVLDLSFQDISGALELLPQMGLRSLKLHGCKLSKADVSKLSALLTCGLEDLDVTGNDMTSQQVTQFLTPISSSTLTILAIGGNSCPSDIDTLLKDTQVEVLKDRPENLNATAMGVPPYGQYCESR